MTSASSTRRQKRSRPSGVARSSRMLRLPHPLGARAADRSGATGGVDRVLPFGSGACFEAGIEALAGDCRYLGIRLEVVIADRVERVLGADGADEAAHGGAGGGDELQ